jgi:hypothetical protein
MLKVTHQDLEEITKHLDSLVKSSSNAILTPLGISQRNKTIKLSKMIKDKYTEIKPDYDRID